MTIADLSARVVILAIDSASSLTLARGWGLLRQRTTRFCHWGPFLEGTFWGVLRSFDPWVKLGNPKIQQLLTKRLHNTTRSEINSKKQTYLSEVLYFGPRSKKTYRICHQIRLEPWRNHINSASLPRFWKNCSKNWNVHRRRPVLPHLHIRLFVSQITFCPLD